MGKMDNYTWADLYLQCDWIELLRLCFKMFQEVLLMSLFSTVSTGSNIWNLLSVNNQFVFFFLIPSRQTQPQFKVIAALFK